MIQNLWARLVLLLILTKTVNDKERDPVIQFYCIAKKYDNVCIELEEGSLHCGDACCCCT